MILERMIKQISTVIVKKVPLNIGSLKMDPKCRNLLSHINIKLFILYLLTLDGFSFQIRSREFII
jgi:hypothetical protein